MPYHVAGIISALLTTLALTGLLVQLRLIWQRKRLTDAGELLNERPTTALSVNRFITSFLAYFSFLVYGAITARFNHYLVWPRVGALLLTLAILFECMIDRRQKRVAGAFVFCATLTAFGLGLIAFRPPATPLGTHSAAILICGVTVMYLQGGIAQLRTIRRSGQTGGLSLALHVLFCLKDAGTAVFAAITGWRVGWPVILLSTSGVIIQTLTIYHFRWVQTSPKAKRRRGGLAVVD